MPPANKPPSCGAESVESPPLLRLSWSLLLLALFPGTGGARPPGGAGALPRPGTGGAPPMGGPPPPPETFPTWGADRSFVTVFFNALPFDMSLNKAPLPAPVAGGRGSPPGGGGGGGGPPMPGGGGGGGGGGGISENRPRASECIYVSSIVGWISGRRESVKATMNREGPTGRHHTWIYDYEKTDNTVRIRQMK